MATGRGAHSCAGVRPRTCIICDITIHFIISSRWLYVCFLGLLFPSHAFYHSSLHLSSSPFFFHCPYFFFFLLPHPHSPSVILPPFHSSLTPLQVSAYCVGNLNMPENPLPWETVGQEYASNLATPASIMVDASNGASDYGTCVCVL
jgi:hypothetical protein